MRWDEGRKLIWQGPHLWIGAMFAGELAETQDSAMLKALTSVAKPVVLDGIIAQNNDDYVIQSEKSKQFWRLFCVGSMKMDTPRWRPSF